MNATTGGKRAKLWRFVTAQAAGNCLSDFSHHHHRPVMGLNQKTIDRPTTPAGQDADQAFTRDVRGQVLQTVAGTVRQRLFDPSLNGKDWDQIVASRSEGVLDAATPEAFVDRVKALVSELDLHPLDFFQEQRAKAPFHRIARATVHPYQERWMLQDVHVDGPADQAGLVPGDQIVAINGTAVRASKSLIVPSGGSLALTVLKRSGAKAEFELKPQGPAERKVTRYVLVSEPEPGVGLLKVTMFPGLVGVDMAAAIDKAISSLSNCERLIVDLRGNPGGGSANLRLMSYLTPQKIPVGYSLTRPRAQAGYRREELPQFRRIPSNKLALIWLALRFKWVDKSIVVVTEGLGRQKFHGKIVLLVNEHTTSGAEIVVGFARENKLATIVGSRTAGRLLGWASLPVGHGFRLTIPVSNYITWEGRCYENSGMAPDVDEPFRPELALAGQDNQLEAAIRVARSL